VKYKTILIDGRHLLFRCADAMRELGVEDENGFTNTGAIFGFIKSVIRVWTLFADDGCWLCVCWEGGKTIRRQIYDGYKRKDEVTDPDVQEFLGAMMEQEKWLRGLLSYAGWWQARSIGYEADDTMGALAREMEDPDNTDRLPVAIYTGDADLHQCVGSAVHVISPPRPPNRPTETIWTIKDVTERWAVPPRRVPEYKALAGDSSDKIPGVKGIGDVWAKKLLTSYGNLAKLEEAAKSGEVSGIWDGKEWKSKPIALRVADDLENMWMSHKLATIVTDAPVEFIERRPDAEKLRKSLAVFKMMTLMSSVPFGNMLAIGNI
jgi:DNA polymerase-1